MTKSLKSMLETLPETRQRKIELRTSKLIEEQSYLCLITGKLWHLIRLISRLFVAKAKR